MPRVKTKAKIVREGSSVKSGSIIEVTQEELDMNPELFEVVTDEVQPEPDAK